MPRFIFRPDDGPAEVCVVVVTYNNAEDVPGLLASLRAQADDVAIRVVVADNASQDHTVTALQAHRDVTLLHTGGNLGYAGGINAAMPLVPEGEPILVLNPDLQVELGALKALLGRLRDSDAGIVAPRILDTEDNPARSIRREPSVIRALGDALWGSRFPQRPGWLSDEVADLTQYTTAHPVEWASGAALLIRHDVASAIGAWDERFFLYSEETDFQRRAREAGHSVWFEPSAKVVHRQGGSGTSRELLALMEVNRIRYVRKHRGPAAAAVYRCVVALHQLFRAWQPDRRHALGVVLNMSSWQHLPKATRG